MVPSTFLSSEQIPLVRWREVRRDQVLISVDYFNYLYVALFHFHNSKRISLRRHLVFVTDVLLDVTTFGFGV